MAKKFKVSLPKESWVGLYYCLMVNSSKLSVYPLVFSLLFMMGCAQWQRITPWPQTSPEEATASQKELSDELPVERLEERAKEKHVEQLLSEPPPIPPYFVRAQSARQHTQAIIDYCRKIDERFLHWGWGLSGCRNFQWHHVRDSVNGDPLMWVVFGDESEIVKGISNVTFIMCGVHGDEITPIKFCFDVLHELNANYNSPEFKDTLVVVYPIANPDGFFIDRPTRVNARGVDVNRNLPTQDWQADALRLWRTRHRSDPRRYPGERPLSEPETITQVNLIKRYAPQKIISVHSPLTILDYDGPVEITPQFGEVGPRASELLVAMAKKADGYEVRNFPFFPGSLGNYAGNERGIPTYTLELPSIDNRRHRKYWDLFRPAINAAILHDLRSPAPDSKIVESNASLYE